MRRDSQRLRFGAFIAPYHRTTTNPTLALRRDLQLIEFLDELGFDEAWVGEHHSGGVETVGSPEMMLAAAAQRTRRIRLGTGVSSIPYHNPFLLADRIAQLDQMSEGRAIFGAGPGQLLDDALMLGIDPATQRPRTEEGLEVILRLLRGETVTQKSEWFTLQDARLNLLPHSPVEVAVAGAISPNGPKLAGRYGTGLLSLAATSPAGIDVLAQHWKVVETEAAYWNQTVDRSGWRLLGPMHIADTMEQARRDAEYGLKYLLEYLAHVNPAPYTQFADHAEAFDWFNESGGGLFGTVDMAIERIESLVERSGGFGTYLFQHADWTPHAAQLRSYELFAERVMPHFAGSLDSLQRGYDAVIDRGYVNAEVTAQSQAGAAERYRAERETRRGDRHPAPNDLTA